MKFLTMEQGNLGALVEEIVVDINEASKKMGADIKAKSLSQLVELGEDAALDAWALGKRAVDEGVATYEYDETKVLAPFPQPNRNIFCLGKNYYEHAKEIVGMVDKGVEIPKNPIFFTKATTSVIGPGKPIPSHSDITSMLDYEAELAIVIGKKGINILPEHAWDHVFGYTAFNDVTARDLQLNHLQWFFGKSLDGFSPMGPVVVHRSVMPPIEEVEISCRVNGEKRQKGTLDQLIFDIPAILSILSSGITLLPGDIIATGTPAGVGMGFNPPRFLQTGDEVVVEVTGVGKLINRVV